MTVYDLCQHQGSKESCKCLGKVLILFRGGGGYDGFEGGGHDFLAVGSDGRH